MSKITGLSILMAVLFIILTVATLNSEYHCRKALKSELVPESKKVEIRAKRKRAREYASIALGFILGEVLFIIYVLNQS